MLYRFFTSKKSTKSLVANFLLCLLYPNEENEESLLQEKLQVEVKVYNLVAIFDILNL